MSTEYWLDIYGDVQISHKLFIGKTNFEVLLEVMYNNQYGPSDFSALNYELREDYQTDQVLVSDTLDMDVNLIGREGSKYYYRFNIPHKKEATLMVLALSKKNPVRTYFYPISVDTELNFSNDGLYLTRANGGLPVFRSFIHENDTVRISTIKHLDTLVHVYYYNDVFDAALPPMVIENTSVSKDFTFDSLFTVSTKQDLRFGRSGLYFIQLDSNTLKGVGIRVVDRYYPTLNKIDELGAPLLYISKREEMEAIEKASDKKESFESFWIELAGNPAKASQLIRQYYDQVEEANYFFTTYKEGWKTDMGMIYIIYGKPDEVYCNAETTDWVYNRNLAMPIIRFTFIKVKSIFSNNYYSLMRKKNFDRHWFMSVKLWRDGKK
jgi:GWxTD domain-containing protein